MHGERWLTCNNYLRTFNFETAKQGIKHQLRLTGIKYLWTKSLFEALKVHFLINANHI